MEIRETPWEQRNLNVASSVEFFVSSEQSEDELAPIWQDTHAYQVLNIDVGNVPALMLAQENGFRLIEAKLNLTRTLSDITLPPLYRRYENVLGYHYAEPAEIRDLLAVVRSGEMFLTDRIALDPFFGTKQSGQRYAYWAEDVLAKDGVAVISIYKDKPVGFEIYSENDGKCTNIIGGVFPEYANSSLGFAPLYTELLSQSSRGNKKVSTCVSSNNPSAFKVHEMLGFRLNTISYSLIRHR